MTYIVAIETLWRGTRLRCNLNRLKCRLARCSAKRVSLWLSTTVASGSVYRCVVSVNVNSISVNFVYIYFGTPIIVPVLILRGLTVPIVNHYACNFVQRLAVLHFSCANVFCSFMRVSPLYLCRVLRCCEGVSYFILPPVVSSKTSSALCTLSSWYSRCVFVVTTCQSLYTQRRPTAKLAVLCLMCRVWAFYSIKKMQARWHPRCGPILYQISWKYFSML